MSVLRSQIITIFLASCLLACGNSEGKLNGEVFIVTQGGQNIKLGLVTFRVIPEADILAFINKKSAEALSEMYKMIPIYNKAKQEANEAKDAEDKALQRMLRMMNAGEPYNKQVDKDRLDKLVIWKSKLDRLAILQAELNNYKSGKFYFNGLPDGIEVAKTNADGKFTIPMKRNVKYALAAQAQRTIGDSKEEYYWLIWVSLENNTLKNIILSNDNLIDAHPQDAVLPRNCLLE